MTEPPRPDPLDWGARSVFGLALLYGALGAVVAVVGLASESTSLTELGLPVATELVAMPLAFALGFGGLTYWYYRHAAVGRTPEPFPRSLPGPAERLARLVGLGFLVAVSVLLGGIALALPEMFGASLPAAVEDQRVAVAAVLGIAGLAAYLHWWYRMREPATA